MAKLSLLDKINVLIKITSSSKIFLVVIISLLFLAYIFITTNKKNFKTSKIVYLSIYAIIMASLLFTYRTSLANIFDYFMNNLFIVIYFPNLAIYSVAIIISNIILWISLFSEKSNKIIKIINVFVYCIMTYILILILNIISINKLDVFTQASIYGNTDALALIELSSVVFVTWICFLIVYKIICAFQKSREKEVVKEKVAVKDNKPTTSLPKSYRLVEAPYFIKAQNKNITVEPNTKAYSDLLTVEDYKLLLNILSNHKKGEYVEDKQKQELEHIKLLEAEREKQIEEELRKEKKLEEIKKQQLEQLAEIKKLEEIKKTKVMEMNQIKIEKEPIELLDINQPKTDTEKSKFQQLQDMYRSVR